LLLCQWPQYLNFLTQQDAKIKIKYYTFLKYYAFFVFVLKYITLILISEDNPDIVMLKMELKHLAHPPIFNISKFNNIK
jgi:hypothetical protein